jgi:hypothetical protein
MGHVILVGDSILDNAPYVAAGQDVSSHLRRMLPRAWDVTLRAVDGSTLVNIESQIVALPEDTTHLVFSCGGNDALCQIESLTETAGTIGETLRHANRWQREFLDEYHKVLGSLSATGKRVIVLTIYDPQFEETELQQAAEAALCLYNDGITRAAFEAGATVVDLRCLFNEASDMANPIEPSETGGAKIASVLRDICLGENGGHKNSRVYAKR